MQSSFSFLGKKMPKHHFVQINPNPIRSNQEDQTEEHEELGPGASLLFALNSVESFFTYQAMITFAFFLIIVITLMVGN